MIKGGGGYNTQHKNALLSPNLAQGKFRSLDLQVWRSQQTCLCHLLRHRLARPEMRTGRARQGEAIKDSLVGAFRVVLPPVGVL
jgi:hypothetical protein